MELVLHAGAASFAFRSHRLDPEHVRSVWGEVTNLDWTFPQNQDFVGGHISLAIFFLQRQKEVDLDWLPNQKIHKNFITPPLRKCRREQSTQSYFHAVHKLIAVIDVGWRSARQSPGQSQAGGAAIIQMDKRHLGGI